MRSINEFLILIEKIKQNKINKNLSLEIVSNDWEIVKNIVRNGIKFDNNKTCYYGFSSIDEMAFCIITDSIIYNVLYDNNQIGLVSICNYDEKDDEVEIAICLNKEYRNLNIGTKALKLVLDDCFLNGVTKVHALIRIDNYASIKLIEKLNFKKYEDDCKMNFITGDNKVIKQKHYVLLKKEN